MLGANLKQYSTDMEKSGQEEDREMSSFPLEAFDSDDGLSSKEAIEQWNNMSSKEKANYEKKLVRKLDLRIIPWLTLLYLLSFLDRTNIGNAKIQGVCSIPNLRLTCSSQKISTFQILNMRYACLYFSLRMRYSRFLPIFFSR